MPSFVAHNIPSVRSRGESFLITANGAIRLGTAS